MITRDQLRELAQLEIPEGTAVSFYFQPSTPQNKSHRGEHILVKDLVRDALREAERATNGHGVREDLGRILEMSESLHGNHARAKVIFACRTHNLWREFDLPPRLRSTELFVNRRFHMRPLAGILGGSPRAAVVLMDREKARVFDLWMDELQERMGFFDELPRRGRSDGFAGYDGGHAERHVDNEAMRHYKFVFDRLLRELKRGNFGCLLVGCHHCNWAEIEPHLHPYLKQRLVGRFLADPAAITAEQLRQQAARLLAEHQQKRREQLIALVVGESRRKGRGASGLRHVLKSLERGEVQTLLLGEGFAAAATECANCGHMDTRMVDRCPICANPARAVDDVTDAILARALAADIDVITVPDDGEFSKVGNIAALLRFRSEQPGEERKAG